MAGGIVPDRTTPGRSALLPAKKAGASKPARPVAPKAFPGVKSPARKATSKSGKPGRLRAAPKGTALTPNV